MHNSSAACAALLLALTANAHAATPSVAVDIAPLHSLVSQVMEDVAEPNLLIPAGASPHHYTLRPSEATALENADVVFWIGDRLSPWLGKALGNLAGSAESIEVLGLEGTSSYPKRKSATFEAHSHGEDEGEQEHHKDENEKDEHDNEEHNNEEHNNEEHKNKSDPHAWLDPENAKLWVKHISEVLSLHDPDNASVYNRNATAATASLDSLIQSTRTQIDALGQPY